MKAADLLNIDHRWIWLWAEEGKVWHVEIESPDGRRKTYYSIADLRRLVDSMPDKPAYPEGGKYADSERRLAGAVAVA
jgi:hypothetical protein